MREIIHVGETMWASGILAILGVVIGVLLTYFLGRKQRLVDIKTAEFRDLLAGINRGFSTMLALASNPPFFHSDEYTGTLADAEAQVAATIAARIFIAPEVGKLRAMERWTTAARKFAKDKDVLAFGNEVNRLSEDIRKAALKSI
jgi:hypothetical protein